MTNGKMTVSEFTKVLNIYTMQHQLKDISFIKQDDFYRLFEKCNSELIADIKNTGTMSNFDENWKYYFNTFPIMWGNNNVFSKLNLDTIKTNGLADKLKEAYDFSIKNVYLQNVDEQMKYLTMIPEYLYSYVMSDETIIFFMNKFLYTTKRLFH